MKLFKYGLPFAALAILASCSNDNLDAPADGAQGPSQELEPGTYMSISISIPYSGNRAPQMENGTPNEYAVKDATLYVYSDNGGEPGDCIGFASLDGYFQTNPNNSEITATSTIANINVETDDLKLYKDGSSTYWALIIINKNGLKVGEITNEPAKGQSFSAWAALTPQCTMRDGDNFTMTNALGWDLSNTDPTYTSTAPKWLAKITQGHLYRESETPTAGPVKIFVQRGVAKVTLAQASAVQIGTATKVIDRTKKDLGQEESDDVVNSDYIKLEQWYLDILSTSTYPVQRLTSDGVDNWPTNGGLQISDWSSSTDLAAPMNRFVGGSTDYKRMYWCVDPTYKNDWTAPSSYDNALEFFTTDHPATPIENHNDPAYCLENTFAVTNMNLVNTTRVVFKGTYYAELLPSEINNGAPNIDAPNFLSYEGKVVRIPDYPYFTLPEASTDAVVAIQAVGYDESKVEPTSGDVVTDEDKNAAKEKYDDFIKLVRKTFNLNENSNQTVSYHEAGEVYYTVLVRHFDDPELGLATATDLGTDLNYKDGKLYLLKPNYPDDKDKYLLGRYGVVRNNWYEINLTKVAGPGTALVPTPDNTPDDEPAELMLQCEINILAWAKRQQSEVLGQ